jgi:sulfide:quinone oxidoreductase
VRRLLDRRVEFLEGSATAINPPAHTVQVGGETLTFDWLVLATGTRLTPERIPGFTAAHHFYDLESATHLRDALRALEVGRIVVEGLLNMLRGPAGPGPTRDRCCA